MPSTSPSLSPVPGDKKHWWLRNKKVVDRYLREARALAGTKEHSNVAAAVGVLDAALALSPRLEGALELKARSLLFLGRFREVADMLEDYIPSYRVGRRDDESTTTASEQSPCVKLLPSPGRDLSGGANCGEQTFRCFSVSELKRRVLAGLVKNEGREGQWRYLVLGHACSHLGLMEDAMVLLQTGRRLASAAFRRQSVCWSDDSFSPSSSSDLDSASHLLSHVKLLLRRRAAASAALDAGLPAESIRHFTKILDARRSLPSPFAAACLIGRAAAYRAAGRLAEAVADCNRSLALDSSSIPALRARADLLESLGALSECLRDLDLLKLLYDAILRDGKLLGPRWRPQTGLRFCDIPASLSALTKRAQRVRCRVAAGEGFDVDYYKLIGVERGCTRSELERAHLVLTLRHRPERAAAFVDRVEFADELVDLDAVRDQAKMSASILFRMLQKGYSCIMSAVMEEEAAKKLRAATMTRPPSEKGRVDTKTASKECELGGTEKAVAAAAVSMFQGVFCRDLAVVGSMLSHRATIPVKYEAMSC